jgi:hypothetical protein
MVSPNSICPLQPTCNLCTSFVTGLLQNSRAHPQILRHDQSKSFRLRHCQQEPTDSLSLLRSRHQTLGTEQRVFLQVVVPSLHQNLTCTVRRCQCLLCHQYITLASNPLTSIAPISQRHPKALSTLLQSQFKRCMMAQQPVRMIALVNLHRSLSNNNSVMKMLTSQKAL